MSHLFSRGQKTLPVFDIEMSRSQIECALQFVSRELHRQAIHLILVATGDVIPSFQLQTRPTCKTIHILPIAPLSTKETAALARALKKAAQKYSLGQNWVAISPYAQSLDNKTKSALIEASMLQREMLYEDDGLSLLMMDLCFDLKLRLAGMTTDGITRLAMAEAVILLRRFINVHKGRPLPARYLRRSYPNIIAPVSDQVLLALDDEYHAVFFHSGVAGVNVEQSAWRREGKNWTEEMEQYTRHLSLVKKRSVCSFVSDDSDISLCSDDISECNADLAAIWDQHGMLI